jgi:flavorubredoxin
MICPLHGPIWRENLGWFIDKYQKWSTYTPEDHTVLILYASIYGNTENAMNVLAGKLADAGEKNIAMYDVSVTDPSYLLAEAFRCDRIVFASPTYNAGIFPKMETLLNELKAHNLQNRKVAVAENGTWAISAGKQMKEILSQMKNMDIYENVLTVKSSLKEEQFEQLDGIVEFMTK